MLTKSEESPIQLQDSFYQTPTDFQSNERIVDILLTIIKAIVELKFSSYFPFLVSFIDRIPDNHHSLGHSIGEQLDIKTKNFIYIKLSEQNANNFVRETKKLDGFSLGLLQGGLQMDAASDQHIKSMLIPRFEMITRIIIVDSLCSKLLTGDLPQPDIISRQTFDAIKNIAEAYLHDLFLTEDMMAQMSQFMPKLIIDTCKAAFENLKKVNYQDDAVYNTKDQVTLSDGTQIPKAVVGVYTTFLVLRLLALYTGNYDQKVKEDFKKSKKLVNYLFIDDKSPILLTASIARLLKNEKFIKFMLSFPDKDLKSVLERMQVSDLLPEGQNIKNIFKTMKKIFSENLELFRSIFEKRNFATILDFISEPIIQFIMCKLSIHNLRDEDFELILAKNTTFLYLTLSQPCLTAAKIITSPPGTIEIVNKDSASPTQVTKQEYKDAMSWLGANYKKGDKDFVNFYIRFSLSLAGESIRDNSNPLNMTGHPAILTKTAIPNAKSLTEQDLVDLKQQYHKIKEILYYKKGIDEPERGHRLFILLLFAIEMYQDVKDVLKILNSLKILKIIELKNEQGETPLVFAIRKKHVNAVDKIVKSSEHNKITLDTQLAYYKDKELERDYQLFALLLFAIEMDQGVKSVLKILSSLKISEQILESKNGQGESPLTFAIYKQKIKVVNTILEFAAREMIKLDMQSADVYTKNPGTVYNEIAKHIEVYTAAIKKKNTKPFAKPQEINTSRLAKFFITSRHQEPPSSKPATPRRESSSSKPGFLELISSSMKGKRKVVIAEDQGFVSYPNSR
jgi:ankyrin repeat protein